MFVLLKSGNRYVIMAENIGTFTVPDRRLIHMSKIICDVCGTVFPETAAQCPICGCAKSPTAQAVTQEDSQPKTENAGGYSYVKGGRFSKNNVRRAAAGAAPERQSAPQHAPQRQTPRERTRREQPENNNKGLIAVVAILLVAIIIVVVYIGVMVFLPGSKPDTGDTQAPSSNQSGSPEGSETLPCTELKLNRLTQEFKSETEKLLLGVETVPADTTDKILFSSADPSVATVDQNGLILPVSHGKTVITVTCGAMSAQCEVICSFGEPEPTDPPTEPIPTAPAGFTLTLNTYKGSGEITISEFGGSHQLFKEKDGVKPSDILWTSSDPTIATVENGKVVGMNRGKCTITAQIGDQIAECLVRCSFDRPEETEPAPYNISTDDVTLNSKSKSFTLTLRNADMSNVQNVEWSVSLEGYLEIDGNKITCINFTEKKVITVSTTIDGYTYSCVVRITPDTATDAG